MEIADFYTKAFFVDFDNCLTVSFIFADFVNAFAFPFDFDSGTAERSFSEFTDSSGFVCGDNIIIRSVLLEHQPHCLDIIFRMSPVALGIQIAEFDIFLQAELDSCDSSGNFSCDKFQSSAFGFVIEQNARTCKQAVALPVILGDPVAASSRLVTPSASVSAVLRGVLQLDATKDCAARL